MPQHGTTGTYEEVLAKLMGQGWKPGDPIPEELMKASGAEPLGSAEGYLAGPEGSFDNERQSLSTR